MDTTVRFSTTNRLAAPLLALGPVVSLLVLRSYTGTTLVPADISAYAAWIIVAAWSPMPIGIPAVVLAGARDMHEARLVGHGRSLYRYLVSNDSGVASETWASLIGFAAAAVSALLLF
jgi:hypothetical protein